MKNPEWKNLKVGDKIRIVSVPGFISGKKVKNYTIARETISAYKKLIARKRPVVISEIDEYGQPWFEFRLRKKGKYIYHSMAVFKEDDNWVRVKPRK